MGDLFQSEYHYHFAKYLPGDLRLIGGKRRESRASPGNLYLSGHMQIIHKIKTLLVLRYQVASTK